jgi:hypothetical protein
MNEELRNIIDILAKAIGSISVLIVVLNYRNQVRIKRAEWLKSLFEKFFENQLYKEARGWLDYDELGEKLSVPDDREKRNNEEKFTDFLNFFEFMGVLHFRGELTMKEVNEVFDYYLKKIKHEENCRVWINKYGFEKLNKLLLKTD